MLPWQQYDIYIYIVYVCQKNVRFYFISVDVYLFDVTFVHWRFF